MRPETDRIDGQRLQPVSNNEHFRACLQHLVGTIWCVFVDPILSLTLEFIKGSQRGCDLIVHVMNSRMKWALGHLWETPSISILSFS